MDDRLDFSLPQKKSRISGVLWFITALMLILIGISSVNVYMMLSAKKPNQAAVSSSLSPEQTKELAIKLSQRNLFDQAAKAWQDYLATANLTNDERAKTLFEIGTLLEKAGSNADAIECFYQSELVSKIGELEPQINAHIKDCFEKLGKFSALGREIADRTSLKGASSSGDKVIAEIGTQKITQADLDAIIENSIDSQLQSMAGIATDEQLKEQKKKILEQTADAKQRKQFLQSWLAQEVLYRQALKEQLPDKPEVKRTLDEMYRNELSQFLLNRYLSDKIHITDSDLVTYFAANKSKYVEPASAQISHILVGSQQQAEDVIGKIKAGGDFVKLAKEFSTDTATKDSGGKINDAVYRGSPVPVIGDVNGLSEKIFDVNAPSVLDTPFKTAKGWEIVRVDKKTAEKQKDFSEVKDQIEETLWSQKRQEVGQQYIHDLMDKYNVLIHNSTIADSNNSEKATQ
jgi:foldase protein PrsA